MKLNWFTRKGIFYLPVTIIGWLILVAAIAIAAYSFMAVDSHSHSNSDTLISFVFNLLLIGLGYTVIGYFTERSID